MDEDTLQKKFKFPVEIMALSKINLENAFTEEFLKLLDELNTSTVGITLGIDDSVVTFGSGSEKEGFFFSIPAIDDEKRDRIFKFLDIIVEEEEEDEAGNESNEK